MHALNGTGRARSPVLHLSERLFDDALLFRVERPHLRACQREVGTQTLSVSVQVTYALR